MSKALALRNAALRLASREGADLDLLSSAKLSERFAAAIIPFLPERGAALLLGTSTPGLAAELADAVAVRTRTMTVIEADPALSEQNLAATPGTDRSRAARLINIGDPTDLRTDPEWADTLVAQSRPSSYADFQALSNRIAKLAAEAPLVPDDSVSLVVVDMLSNRLPPEQIRALLSEAFRVLSRGGSVVMTALLADEPVAADAAVDIGGWRASGFPLETEIVDWLDRAGFHGMTYHTVLDRPVRTVQGVEIRGFVIEASKGKQGICLDVGHAVIYRGPWREVLDDDHHRYVRGERTAVCAKTYDLLMRRPYGEQFIGLPAYQEVPLDQALLFDCNMPTLRSPAVTKGRVPVGAVRSSTVPMAADCCAPAPGAANATTNCCDPAAPGGGCC